MARQLDRSYSFAPDDEQSLGANRQDRHINNYQQPQPYHDISPSRDIYSPQTYEQPIQHHTNSPARHPGRPPLDTYFQPPQPASHREIPHDDHHSYGPPAYTSQSPYHDISNPFDDANRTHSSQDLVHPHPQSRRAPSATPGVDNLGAAAAGGGIAGIALGVANSNERDSGLMAANMHPSRGYDSIGTDSPYIPDPPSQSRPLYDARPYNGNSQPGGTRTPQSFISDGDVQLDELPRNQSGVSPFNDNPYKRYSAPWDPRVGSGDFNPDEILDDGDDDIQPAGRGAALGTAKSSDTSLGKGIVAGAAVGGIMGGATRKATPSGDYGPVRPGSIGFEKNDWRAEGRSRRRKLRWIFGILAVLIAVGVIVGGVVGAFRAQQGGGSANNNNSAAQDDGKGDLNKDSSEIKALLNNPDLHRVFPGMDYTPFNAQYPACLSNPPSQNNVTRDIAVLSQLTKTIRLYGTDCNQTEMVLHSLNALGITDMKVWMAVWLDKNATTNARGLTDMYALLDKHGADPFAGIIVGNEVLFRKDMTITELASVVSDVRTNLTSKSISLPVAIADLGDNWTPALVADIDVVMSNVHPFFAGVTATEAAAWTINFWQTHDVVLTAGTNKKNIISEVGWPSEGGNDCGGATCTSSTQGSVAGITEMNTFMDTFVCQGLANGTDYFW
jgi:exo-beta-1,3-glucanase (GH17 family)